MKAKAHNMSSDLTEDERVCLICSQGINTQQRQAVQFGKCVYQNLKSHVQYDFICQQDN